MEKNYLFVKMLRADVFDVSFNIIQRSVNAFGPRP